MVEGIELELKQDKILKCGGVVYFIKIASTIQTDRYVTGPNRKEGRGWFIIEADTFGKKSNLIKTIFFI